MTEFSEFENTIFIEFNRGNNDAANDLKRSLKPINEFDK